MKKFLLIVSILSLMACDGPGKNILNRTREEMAINHKDGEVVTKVFQNSVDSTKISVITKVYLGNKVFAEKSNHEKSIHDSYYGSSYQYSWTFYNKDTSIFDLSPSDWLVEPEHLDSVIKDHNKWIKEVRDYLPKVIEDRKKEAERHRQQQVTDSLSKIKVVAFVQSYLWLLDDIGFAGGINILYDKDNNTHIRTIQLF